jgi:hypothetical protein
MIRIQGVRIVSLSAAGVPAWETRYNAWGAPLGMTVPRVKDESAAIAEAMESLRCRFPNATIVL